MSKILRCMISSFSHGALERMSEAFVRNVFAALLAHLMGRDRRRRLGGLYLGLSFRQRATPNAVVDGRINLRAAHANVV